MLPLPRNRSQGTAGDLLGQWRLHTGACPLTCKRKTVGSYCDACVEHAPLPPPPLQVHQLPRIPSADLLPTVSTSQPLRPRIGRCTMHFAAWQCHHTGTVLTTCITSACPTALAASPARCPYAARADYVGWPAAMNAAASVAAPQWQLSRPLSLPPRPHKLAVDQPKQTYQQRQCNPHFPSSSFHADTSICHASAAQHSGTFVSIFEPSLSDVSLTLCTLLCEPLLICTFCQQAHPCVTDLPFL